MATPTTSQQRPGVQTLRFAAVAVIVGGAICVAAGLGQFGDDTFGESAISAADKWAFVAVAAIPAVIGSGLLYGLSVVIELLYDLRDGKRAAPVAPAPADDGPAY